MLLLLIDHTTMFDLKAESLRLLAPLVT